MRYFMQLSYNGSSYLGWQIQPQGDTVQGTIENAMSVLLRTPMSVTGAGRTDTGVNARMMIAHFDYAGELPADFHYRLNSMLGKDIAIQRIWPVADDAHARFDATERTYKYFVSMSKLPFLYHFSWRCVTPLDFEAMNCAAASILGRQDFTSFSKLHTQVKTNICDVRQAHWDPVSGADDLWCFTISADRFLRNMVRAVVGTLVDVGRGKIRPDAVADIIARRDRSAAGSSMPPYALFLWDIKY